MTKVDLQTLQSQGKRKEFPRFKSGQTVKVHEKIREGDKERIQIFEGLVIQTGGIGNSKTITIRKIVGGIGVEKVFTLESPIISKIDVIKEAKVRRSKLFFMRDRKGKSARLKEKFLTEKDMKELMHHEVTEEEIEEAIVAQKKSEEEEKKAEAAGAEGSTPSETVSSEEKSAE